MSRRRRSRFLNPFGLAFLDVMSCGLGAAVLLFLIIDHNLTELAQASESGEGDVQLLEQSIQEQEERITEHRRQMRQLQRELESLAQQRVAAITTQAELRAHQPKASDTARLERELRERKKKLQEAEKSRQLRAKEGEGQRQYVAGFRVEGRRILILLDRSASMQDERIATIIRNKFLPVKYQAESYKWRWARSIFEWVLSHLPQEAQYQVWGFSTTAAPALPKSGWLPAKDGKRMEEVVSAVRGWVPSGGTRLDTTLRRIAQIKPRPDAVYLITDGLPTQGKSWFRKNRVSPSLRMDFFQEATGGIASPPFNIVLLPLEGDPAAAGAYWGFAMKTNGQFLAPAEDWP